MNDFACTSNQVSSPEIEERYAQMDDEVLDRQIVRISGMMRNMGTKMATELMHKLGQFLNEMDPRGVCVKEMVTFRESDEWAMKRDDIWRLERDAEQKKREIRRKELQQGGFNVK